MQNDRTRTSNVARTRHMDEVSRYSVIAVLPSLFPGPKAAEIKHREENIQLVEFNRVIITVY
jgi:hypothetical protein